LVVNAYTARMRSDMICCSLLERREALLYKYAAPKPQKSTSTKYHHT